MLHFRNNMENVNKKAIIGTVILIVVVITFSTNVMFFSQNNQELTKSGSQNISTVVSNLPLTLVVYLE